jgi:hypothetical protein
VENRSGITISTRLAVEGRGIVVEIVGVGCLQGDPIVAGEANTKPPEIRAQRIGRDPVVDDAPPIEAVAPIPPELAATVGVFLVFVPVLLIPIAQPLCRAFARSLE